MGEMLMKDVFDIDHSYSLYSGLDGFGAYG